jgi:hypothetical protein
MLFETYKVIFIRRFGDQTVFIKKKAFEVEYNCVHKSRIVNVHMIDGTIKIFFLNYRIEQVGIRNVINRFPKGMNIYSRHKMRYLYDVLNYNPVEELIFIQRTGMYIIFWMLKKRCSFLEIIQNIK